MSLGVPCAEQLHHLAAALVPSPSYKISEPVLPMQAENDIQQALDLLSSPMCNAALQQALVASSVDPQGPSLPSEQPPAVYQPHAAYAEVGVKKSDSEGIIEAPTHGNWYHCMASQAELRAPLTMLMCLEESAQAQNFMVCFSIVAM